MVPTGTCTIKFLFRNSRCDRFGALAMVHQDKLNESLPIRPSPLGRTTQAPPSPPTPRPRGGSPGCATPERFAAAVGGYPTNTLGLIFVGAGWSGLPYFQQVEHSTGPIWRQLTKPKLWSDFALDWRNNAPSHLRTDFISLAERKRAILAE